MSRLKLPGKNIKKYREQRGLSQEKLAENVNLSREYITRVETGVKRISLKNFLKLQIFLKLNAVI